MGCVWGRGREATGLMADALRQWSLHDYGTKHFVRDDVTGEFLYVHGDGALFEDGPFRLDLYENRPLLTGLIGGDSECALHFADDASKYVICEAVHPVSSSAEIKVRRGPDEPTGQWISDLERQYDTKALIIEVGDGFTPFRAEFSWFRAPTRCGDKPVQLWLELRWLIEYTLGQG